MIIGETKMNFAKIAAVAAGAAALSLGFASSAKAEFAASVSFVDIDTTANGIFSSDITGFSGSVAFGDGYAAAATGAAALQVPFGPDVVLTSGYALGNDDTSVFIEVNEINPFDGEEEVIEFTIGDD